MYPTYSRYRVPIGEGIAATDKGGITQSNFFEIGVWSRYRWIHNLNLGSVANVVPFACWLEFDRLIAVVAGLNAVE